MRVVVADDSVLMRRGIVETIRAAGREVVAEAGDARALWAAVEFERPDVAVIDIRMPPSHTTEGLDAARRIRADRPEVAVLVLSQYVESAYALRLVQDNPGSVGYLIKDRILDARVLIDALDRVADGQTLVDPTIVAQLLGKLRRDNPLDRLSDRELEVLALLAEGLSNRAIATRLTVTERTVEAHVRSVFDKLDFANTPEHHRRVLAVLAYLRG
ncbi:response regulator [Nakamurella sp.]|uniref:response regulator n=1 Tax=Nakamurella sp. TaxID=1869182 RepID=UPI003784B177